MVTEEQMRNMRTLVCGMSNSQLNSMKEHIDHEIYLSEKAIEEGMEVRE